MDHHLIQVADNSLFEPYALKNIDVGQGKILTQKHPVGSH